MGDMFILTGRRIGFGTAAPAAALLLATVTGATAAPASFRVQGATCPYPESETLPPAWDRPAEAGALPAVLAESARAKGYVLFSRHYQELIFPRTIPDAADAGAPLRCFLAQGEFEPLTFSVHAVRELTSVRVEVDDLLDSAGNRIAAGNIDVRAVRYHPKALSETRSKVYPKILERRPVERVAAGTTRQFWLTVFAPADAVPGVYTSAVRFTCGNAEPGALALNVRVLPFELRKADVSFGVYWAVDKRSKGRYWGESRAAALAMVKKHMILLRDHGLNGIDLGISPKFTKSDGVVHADYAEAGLGHSWISYADFVRAGLETGLLSREVPVSTFTPWSMLTYGIRYALRKEGDYPSLGTLGSSRDRSGWKYPGSTPDMDAAFRCGVRELLRLARAERWPPLVLTPIDGTGNSEAHKRAAAHFLKLIKEEGGTSGVTINSLNKTNGERQYDDAERRAIDRHLDVRIYEWVDRGVVERTARAGKTLWLYNCGADDWSIVNCRTAYGLQILRTGARGYYQFAYQWPASDADDAYHEAETGENGRWYAYPSPDGPLPTLALEGIREGIDDYRYVLTLRELISECRTCGHAALHDAAERAEQVANDIVFQLPLRRGVNSTPANTGFAAQTPGPTFDIWRMQIAREIMRLQAARAAVWPAAARGARESRLEDGGWRIAACGTRRPAPPAALDRQPSTR
ncbi:MAG: hypothetical protein JXR37_34235 [Kiritimatiellae bacterium]|nr:hypothetical protein [Kiritimatiellia bacterium]